MRKQCVMGLTDGNFSASSSSGCAGAHGEVQYRWHQGGVHDTSWRAADGTDGDSSSYRPQTGTHHLSPSDWTLQS